MAKCITCGREVSSIRDSVVFNCLKCKTEIVRCGKCRKLGLEYKCKCGFSGL